VVKPTSTAWKFAASYQHRNAGQTTGRELGLAQQ
jgi:hypothetical protein